MPLVNRRLTPTHYTITDLAKDFNVTTRTIRFYEDQGLLSPQREGRKRIYSHRDRTRLKLILRGKRLSFTLSEIRELFELFDSAGGEEKQLRRFIKILRERRAILKQQQRDIEAVLHEIDGAEAECAKRLVELEKPAPELFARREQKIRELDP
ncbi:MAG: MerR family DNA-binding transcriptional regulator [Gammaproteobacteria bacterium]|nr:MerR family DNA-binding transcriptional regulator [Gammaproteobacteria bacterium]MCP5425464.1 MerR family DNA-binding transcriptional regulator [Gammaproteobacteria bacterium]MCP5459933.1 MerR family DNA-binding transcriptional regulator [Gammaproteobacteria bacterium]